MSNLFKTINFLKNHQMFKLIKNSFIYGIGDVIQRAISLLLLPIYTRYLKPEDYGVISLLSISGMLLGTVTMCGLTNGIGRYFYYTKQENVSVSEVVWSPFIFICIFSVTVLTPIIVVSGTVSNMLFDTAQYANLVVLTLIGIFVGNLSGVGRSILIFEERAMTVNIINVGSILINVAAGLIMVVYLKRGVSGIVEAGLIGSVITMIPILMITVFRNKPAFSFPVLKKELIFSLPLVAAVFAFWIIDYSDRYILNIFLPLSEVGLYDVGYNFGLIMMILVGGFTSAWPPYYHHHNQKGEGQTICNGVLKTYLLVTSVCVVCLSLASPLMLKLFTAEKFHQAYTVVPWVAMAYMLKGPYIIFLMGILMKNKTLWQLYLEVAAAVVNILGNFLLIPLIGREAAAITTLFSYCIMCSGAYFMVMHINPIPKLSARAIIAVLSLTVLGSATALVFKFGGLGYFLISFLIFAIVILSLFSINYKDLRLMFNGISE